MRGAAERAERLGAHDQAVAFPQQALQVTTDPIEQAELLLQSARSADFAGHYERSEAFARQALERYDGSGDAAGAGRTSAQLGQTLIDAGRVGDAVPVLEAGLKALPADGHEAVRATIMTNLSRALFRNDQPARAIEVADQALPIAERLDLEELIAEAFNNKASALSYVGRRREAVAIHEAAVRTAQQGGFLAAELRARNNLASSLTGDDLMRGLAEAEAGIELGQRSGNRPMTTWLIGSSAYYRYSAGIEWDLALGRVQAIVDDTSEPADEHRALSIALLFRIARGEPIDDQLHRLESMLADLADPIYHAVMDWLRGDLAFSLGAYAEAYDAYLRSVAASPTLASYILALAVRSATWLGDSVGLRTAMERLDADPDVTLFAKASRLEAHASLSALAGDIAEATNGYVAALRGFAEVGAGFDKAMCGLTFIHAVGPQVSEARAAGEEARAIFGVGRRRAVSRAPRRGARPSLGRQSAEHVDRLRTCRGLSRPRTVRVSLTRARGDPVRFRDSVRRRSDPRAESGVCLPDLRATDAIDTTARRQGVHA